MQRPDDLEFGPQGVLVTLNVQQLLNEAHDDVLAPHLLWTKDSYSSVIVNEAVCNLHKNTMLAKKENAL